MNRKLFTLLAGVLVLAALSARAQWITQTFQLKAGWNAVFLHVDAAHATLDQLVGAGAPVLTPIEEVWRWTPNPATAQFIVSPQQPVEAGSQWASWKRAEPAAATLERLAGNLAYLVYVTADYAWTLRGRPVLPDYEWSTTGLNFFGFPTDPAAPPTFEDFLAAAPALQLGEIYRYPGGPFGAGNPARLFALRTTPVRRGEAFWLRAGQEYNRYYGPFAVTAGGGEAAFGDARSTHSLRLRNHTDAPLTVTLRLAASEAPPAGQPALAGVPPLLVRGALNPTNLTYAYAALPVGAAQAWTLAPAGQPGADAEVVLGLDRAAITQAPGALLAGLLHFTDSLGHTRVDVGVSAAAASSAGLWVGAASVTGVAQYLKTYERDGTGALLVETNGAYVVSGVITNITPVPAAFPLRLIIHNPATGPATLLQRAYFGLDAGTNPVVANLESALGPALRGAARRLSATHLPWTAANPGWDFSGPLARGAVLVAGVTNAFTSHESNPFLHTYHPDHDGLDNRFRQELPQGSESYTIVREVVLSVQPPADDFSSRVGAGRSLAGEYFETIRILGLARGGGTFDTREFAVRGGFQLNLVSEIATLTRVP
jgi:hypothetical protein